MSDTEQYGGISRRTLVKSSAIGSLALAAGEAVITFWNAHRRRCGTTGDTTG